jgi:ATP-dependent DNA helicase RecQ
LRQKIFLLTVHQILKQYWGYDAFRPLQEDIINAVMDGKDALALLPTGGGKSLCFQVPAMAKEGICLVVSPLIALMKDQVENLKQKGIPALFIYSGMSLIEVKKTLQNAAYGNYKFLYVSPERLETNLFLDFLPSMKVSLIAVDEAHCISQWGYDFRPPYLRIAQLREHIPAVPVLALTASATKSVQDDICEKLLFQKNHLRFQQSFERPNLSYSVFNVASKQNKLLEILKNVKGSAIVYCKSRRHTKDIAEILKLNNIGASFYHAGLSNEERNKRQEDWINNTVRVMACTNAFGMGIDKPNVRVVVHYDVPDCLENYYQEAGRAGRDAKKAYAVLLYNERELNDLELQGNSRYPGKDEIKTVYTALMNYLQIPAGAGMDSTYDFDLNNFCNAFKLNAITANYAIKAMEQQEVLTYNEAFFNPSTLVFNCSKDELEIFEQGHPQYQPVIKGLLRSYAGIFDFPSFIYETKLAKMIGIEPALMLQQLMQLQSFGIIEYERQKDKPQITLQQNRMYADSFQLNLENHLKRKLYYENRLKAIIDFIKDLGACRSKKIADYFNAAEINKCSICDNCINQKATELSTQEFEEILNIIISHVNDKPAGINELLNSLNKIKKEKIWKVLDYLQAEEKIILNKEGMFVKNI